MIEKVIFYFPIILNIKFFKYVNEKKILLKKLAIRKKENLINKL